MVQVAEVDREADGDSLTKMSTLGRLEEEAEEVLSSGMAARHSNSNVVGQWEEGEEEVLVEEEEDLARGR